MSSYELLFGSSSSDDDEVMSEFTEFVEFAEFAWNAYQASQPKVPRRYIPRDHGGAHNRLVAAYFSENPLFDERTFCRRFRMSRELFTRIVRDVTDYSPYFQQTPDCRGIPGISPLVKCTTVIRQLGYAAVPDSLDENLAVAATTARDCLRKFCNVIMELYGAEYLRKPTYSDLERLYAHHEHKHGFPGMMGSIDCTSWEWENCPNGLRGQYARGDHGPNPFILLEAVASQDLWIWHAFFGVSGMNNDVNVLHRSPVFNDIRSGRTPDLEFEANDVQYKRGYYLTDGIYPQWSVLIKSISNPPMGDEKRILYKRKHEAARKDVERAFGVLKKKWKMLKVPARGMNKNDLRDIIYTCIILHNMIIQHKQRAICPTWFENEGHQPHDPLRTFEESLVVTQEIQDSSTHLHLKSDLIEHIWRNRRNHQLNQENEDEDEDDEEDDEEFL